MTLLRRLTQLVTIALVLGGSVCVILELTGAIHDSWRVEVADIIGELASPDLSEWALALLGAALGMAAITLIAAQLAPERKGRGRMLEISQFDDGQTRLAGRAALRAVEYELTQIEGVTAATAVMPTPKRIHATLRADDRCNLDEVVGDARRRLDTPFWINLGLPDIAIEFTAAFDPRPPRVR